MTEREKILAYLKQELQNVIDDEDHYLTEGLHYAIQIISGEPGYDDFQREPDIPLDDFLKTFDKPKNKL
jgi:hypothetical protein